MSGGVFAISRGLFKHPLFDKGQPYTDREAWIWLIGEASWRERKTRAGNVIVSLARGECAHSIRFMAEAWNWHRSKVERFLERLKIETMIETRIETGVTVIKVCNYDEYQKVSLPNKTGEETQTEEVPRQQRDKLEDREIHPIATLDAREPSFDDLESALKSAAGEAIDPTSYGIMQISAVRSWLAAGADLELDILPTIRAKCTGRAGLPIRSWDYFTQAIADARERRARQLPPAAVIPINRDHKNAPTIQQTADALADWAERRVEAG